MIINTRDTVFKATKMRIRHICSMLAKGFVNSFRRKYIIGILVIVAFSLLSWLASNALSFQFFDNYMSAVSRSANSRLVELRAQVNSSFTQLNELDTAVIRCSADIFSQQAELTRKWRYVYETAVRLESGVVCSSFGAGQTSKALPDKDKGYYSADTGRYYWLRAGRDISADAGSLAIAQGNSYVWLNKGILLDMLAIPPKMTIDLIDESTLESLFSSENSTLKLSNVPVLGTIELNEERLLFASPVIELPGLFTLATLPKADFDQVWRRVFAGLVLSSLLMFFAVYRAGRYAYVRYFSLRGKLRTALSQNQLQVHYQPIVDMQTGQWKGAESLLRWNVDGVPVPPAVFIPLAEQTGLIRDLTRWVCQRVAEEHSTYLWACKDLYVTINLSAADVVDATFPDFVGTLFRAHEIQASRIVFEVTEGTHLDKEVASVQLQRLRELGHKIAVDDFGTGYSNLSYLKDLPVDILKIDRAFLMPGKMHSPDALWRYVANMAHSLKLSVVAEGVEVVEQVAPLLSGRVTLAQGWFYSRDMPIELFASRFFALRRDPAVSAVI